MVAQITVGTASTTYFCFTWLNRTPNLTCHTADTHIVSGLVIQMAYEPNY